MNFKKAAEKTAKVVLLNAACAAGLLAMPALAQDAETSDEIIVTGFRASLQSSTTAKRDSVGFSDSVFAEDIGQMPDINIAESLARIPGVLIAREVNGEGLNIAIRGLNTNFTKTVLNGNQIAVASTGSADSQNVNRELDLDLFPSELFTRLDVNKTYSAHLLEGGVSGLVNMRSARPFDFEDNQVTYSVQGNYGENSETWSPRVALLASGRWQTGAGEFGALIGFSGVRNRSVTNGYETIGVTNANLTYRQCGMAPPVGVSVDAIAAACNTSGGNGYNIAAGANNVPVVPASGASAGLTPGATVDAAFLEANNPGLTAQEIGNALLPRLGRPAYFDGDRDRDAMVIGLQWAPNDMIEFYLDIMGAQATRDFNRLDLMFEVRNSNFMVPINMEIDENNVVTSGTFVNSRLFLEARPYHEEVEFLNINPGVRIQFADNFVMDFQANQSRSVFFREQPTIGLTLSGVNLDYSNEGGDVPTFSYAEDANDPNSDWRWLRVNLQNEKRVTQTEGLHADFVWGDDSLNLGWGVAWDSISRSITALDNTGGWSNYICGGGAPPPPPGGSAGACNGAAGSAIPTADISDYLQPGPAGFVTPDYDAIFDVSNYQQYFDAAPIAQGAATGARSGIIDEGTLGAYIEVNGETDALTLPVRYNLGARHITTDQAITGPVFVNGVFSNFNTNRSEYSQWLPAANIAIDVMENVVIRASASRTLTRPNPNDMLPSINLSDPSAQSASLGNATLEPYLSDNIDIGGEWYTGSEGYLGLVYFQKKIEGFTLNQTSVVPFLDLGVPYSSLSGAQQTAIDNRGGPSVATVNLTTPINAEGELTIKGFEFTWVQPLDFILEGLGFTANYTDIEQEASGNAPVIATNISPVTYNLTGYYENYGFSGRLTYTWNDEQQQTSSPQDGFSAVGAQNQAGHRFTQERGQLDAAFRYTFDGVVSQPQLTLDLININGETRREYQGYENLAYRFYDPGYSILLGVRGTF